MKQEEILEFNKMCLEFLGRKLADYDVAYIEEYTNIECYRDQTLEDLEYHSDWNLIMEVVEKILLFSKATEKWKMFDTIIDYIPNKEAVVKSINEFLIWYNQEERNEQTRRF